MPDQDTSDVRNQPAGGGKDGAIGSSTLFAPRDVGLPRAIGAYTLMRVIGRGAFGTVYEARQEHPRRTVALKVMNYIAGPPTPSAIRRFLLEAELLGRLHHPCIAQVYDADTIDEGLGAIPYFVLEYVPDARPITDYARQRRLGIRERLELFARVCDAVYKASLQGIIHRDLKPANILVDASGQPKVIDFGVARATDSDLAVASQQTRVGDLVGTLAYMSPEQIDADPHAIDVRSDVYSLGVILYELLSEQLPHKVSGLPIHEAARIIREEEPPRLSRLDPGLGGDIETIVRTAMRKDRHWRYQSADELRHNIVRFLSHQPLIHRDPSVRETLQTHWRAFVRRHPGWAYAGVALGACLVAEFLFVPVAYHWTPINRWYLQAQRAALAPVPIDPPFNDVRIISVSKDTLDHLPELGAAVGVPDVNFNNRESLRQLYTILARRLGDAGIRAFVSDIRFGDVSDYDGEFCAAVASLRAHAHRIPAVMAFALDGPNGAARLSPVVATCLSAGLPGVQTAQADSGYLAIELAVRPGSSEALPSLALATYAALQRPDANACFSIDPVHGTITLDYYQPDAVLPGVRHLLQQPEMIPVTAVDEFDPHERTSEPAYGLNEGDLIAVYEVPVPSRKTIADARVDLQWALTADDAALREVFGGRVALLGYTCTAGEEYPLTDIRADFFGVYAHAAAIESLLRGSTWKAERRLASWATLLASAILGALLGFIAWRGGARATRRAWLRYALLLTSAAAVLAVYLAASVVTFTRFQYDFNPIIPLLALALAALGAFHITRARMGAIATGRST